MAKVCSLKTYIFFIFVMTILTLVVMIHYSVRLSQQMKLQMRYVGLVLTLTNGHFETQTLSSNHTTLLQLPHLSYLRNSPTHQMAEGVVENHPEQSSLGLSELWVAWNESLCPENSSSLVGHINVDKSVPKMEEVEKQMSREFGGWVSKGGSWRPTECRARVKMALIIPFRDRYEQLSVFVRHMHPLLKRQKLDYRIFVVEQAGDIPFNRALLFNIGFKEALKFNQYDCFIFHDVDLIPEDDRNEYSCPTSPRHMSVAVDKFRYRLPYKKIFGGVGSFQREHFELINGFSNIFWGWGGEDDNLYGRIKAKGLNLTRPSMNKGRYKMLKIFHNSEKKPLLEIRKERMKRAFKLRKNDGLNSLTYNVEKITERKLYTMVTADVKDAFQTEMGNY